MNESTTTKNLRHYARIKWPSIRYPSVYTQGFPLTGKYFERNREKIL